MGTASEPATPLSVMQSWLGTKEVPGAKANRIIAGTPASWFSLVEHPEIESDEVANCAAAVGAAIVWAAFVNAGFSTDDLKDGGPSAIDLLRDAGVLVALPPRDTRLLARSYCTYGVNARHDPRPGDIMVIPRGAAWQGHVMIIESINPGLGTARCIGANQSDQVSYATHRLSDALAIRRPVAPTAKALREAGSGGVARGTLLKRLGDAMSGGTTGAVIATSVAESVTDATPANAPTAMEALETTSNALGLFNAASEAAIAVGSIFVRHPWLVGIIAIGLVVRVIGLEAIKRRVSAFAAGMPLSSQT